MVATATAAPGSLRVVSDDNYPPYLFMGPDHQPRGYLVDEWKLWEQKTGVHVELIPTDWANAQHMLLDGKADVIEMLFRTPEREVHYDFSEAYAKVSVGIYVDSSISGIDDIDALRGFEVGVERGDACTEHLRLHGINAIKLYRGYTEMIDAVRDRDVRILCMDDYPANYYLYKNGSSVKFTRAFEFYSGDFHRGVRKGDLATLALVDRGMKLITSDEREALRRKWMGRPVSFTPYTQFFAYALLLVGIAGIALGIWVFSLRRAVERRTRDLGFLAYHDALTRLPNRSLLIDRLDHAIKQGEGSRLALFLIGLDHFKRINESVGHEVGDQLIKEVAERLSGIGPTHTVARVGSDAFAVTLQGPLDTTTITAAAERMLRLIGKGFAWGGRNIFISASIGISIYPGDGADGASLLKHADAALGQAKREGRSRFRFYSASLSNEAQVLLDLGEGLREALQRDEFVLLYQPQAELRSGRVVGVEALLRWRRNGTDMMMPDRFVPYAEETGFINAIGDWVLQEACHRAAHWLRIGLPELGMAVNLSPRQFAGPHLFEHVSDALGASGLPPHLLELEITEGSLLQHGAAVSSTLASLRGLGLSLAIDDFGTGYSSLAYLNQFPIQVLKIDRSFLSGLPDDPRAVSLTSTIVAMGRNMNMRVLAEGVENLAQWNFLRDLGCHGAQGWYVGPPMTAEVFEAWMATNPVFPPPGDPSSG
ncbi:putative bifunctional diguanylate cyclase/phosphodiesterase [Dyella telluris]|uniref:EAL domain-containing protein n=1 Tax=Dyella telluris TaxID=2763498 RepID=A0A7G8Q613_9GAMM|nr:EAL domain-containing protein [Dyella telluris]QNK02221.1 EAL domain-containing protein [Dyella telluris]